VYNISKDFHDRLERGQNPVVYVVVHTHIGYRAYARRELGHVFDVVGLLADGSITADGSAKAGSASAGVIEKSGRVTSFSAFERTISPVSSDLLTSYTSKQKSHTSISFSNAGDSYFLRLLPVEPFLGRPLTEYVGFDDMPQSEHLRVFEGVISELVLNEDGSLTVEADER
jgi:hypothetical protein